MLAVVRNYIDRFGILSPSDFEILEEVSELRVYDKKTKLVEIGQVETYLNFVVRGLIRKFFYKGKDEVITQIAREGDLINSPVSFFTGAPSDYVVETIEPSTFISVSKEKIQELYKIDTKWERWGRMIITDLFLQQEYLEIERVRYTTKERFLRFLLNNEDLFQRVPQKYLASYLHIKPETFSRLKHLLFKRSAVHSNVRFN